MLVLLAIAARGISANGSDATFVPPARPDSQATRLKRAGLPGAPWTGVKGAYPMRDDPAVSDLVTRARNGEEQAWDALANALTSAEEWCAARRFVISPA